ncbi:cytochrome d ubiquinol oxidase subunit II [Vibrio vulnificus]|nr:cytochrome d ubiquinol oxidase subunit II [Vibrio vulnificus]
MRDFNNDGEINVQGDFNVTDNSHNEHKLLIHCSSKELLSERPFRRENIKIEQKRKVKRLRPFYLLTVILIFATAFWAMYQGKTDLITILMGLASAFIGFNSLRATVEPNSFQREEQQAIAEINKILKQRRVE